MDIIFNCQMIAPYIRDETQSKFKLISNYCLILHHGPFKKNLMPIDLIHNTQSKSQDNIKHQYPSFCIKKMVELTSRGDTTRQRIAKTPCTSKPFFSFCIYYHFFSLHRGTNTSCLTIHTQ